MAPPTRSGSAGPPLPRHRYATLALALGLAPGFAAPAAHADPAALPEALSAPICVACSIDGSAVRRTYAGDAWRSLEAGEVLASLRPGGEGRLATAQGSAILPYPPRAVWSVLVDFEAWPRFLSLSRHSSLLRSDGNRAWVERESVLSEEGLHFTVVNMLHPETGRIEWSLDPSAPGDLTVADGAFELVPLDEGVRTLLRYRTRFAGGSQGSALLESLLERRPISELFHEIAAEVERRFPRRKEMMAVPGS